MSVKDYKWYNNGIENKRFNPINVQNGWVLGRLNVKRSKNNTCIGKKHYNNGEEEGFFVPGTEPKGWVLGKLNKSVKRKWYNNGETNLYLTIYEEVPEGFVEGKLSPKYDTSVCASSKGKSFYNNGTECKRFITGEQPEGWELGRLDKSNIGKYERTEETRKKISELHKSKEYKDRVNKTLKDKYGEEVINISQLSLVKDKVKNTCIEKYGVDWPCNRPEASLKGNNSKPNLEFEYLLKENNISYEREYPIGKYRYDFRVGNILIEIDPTATHNSTFGVFNTEPKDKNYHLIKTNIAKENGFRCIHLFDWEDPNKIISLLKNRDVVYARKCEVVEITNKSTVKEYCDKYHLQNYANATIHLGLVYEGELVSYMSFSKPRYNSNFEYELIRFVSSKYVHGGAEKLWKYFIKNCSPKSVISYCDNSKFVGNMYHNLGFSLKEISSPSISWVYTGKDIPELVGKRYTDNFIRQRGFDQLFGKYFGVYGKGTSNTELLESHRFVKVYDCGQSRWEWFNFI